MSVALFTSIVIRLRTLVAVYSVILFPYEVQ